MTRVLTIEGTPDETWGSSLRPELHLDFETRSVAELVGPKGVGLHPYATHPTTDIWCAAWTFTDDTGKDHEGIWDLGGDTSEFRAILREKPKLFAHNAGFEHEIWGQIWGPRYGVPAPTDFDEWTCTAAMAAALALPRDLARAAVAMGLDVNKDEKGRRVMLQLAKPRRIEEDGTIVWWDTADKVAILRAYCQQDVRVEHALARKLRPLSAAEREVWLLDHRVNSRGVRVDVQAVKDAWKIANKEAGRLNKELAAATGNKVNSAKDHRGVAEWLRGEGLEVESVDKAHVKDFLADKTLAPNVRKALLIRQEAGRSSLAKLDAFLLRTSEDGRARHGLMYHGASTGRWTGSGIQLHNLMRPWMKYADIVASIDALAFRDPDWLTIWGKPTEVIANQMRSFIMADPGHELVMADFSNIEGRVLAWLAGEYWKLEAFAAFDRGEGADLYLVAVSEMLGIPLELLNEESPERQIGKVFELSMGYQGGHGASINMAGNYGLKIDALAPIIQAATHPAVWNLALDKYDPDNSHELGERDWTALRVSIDSWRRAHPAIASQDSDSPGLWKRLEQGAMAAVANPRRPVRVGKVKFLCTKSVLWCQLPSGRFLAYTDPKIRKVKTPWGEERDAVTFMGVNSKTKQWVRQNAYGGLWAENITQAVARDVMAAAMLRVEARGWRVVLTVHDEIVSEVLQGSVTAEEFSEVMRILEPWAAGLPVAAKGMSSLRYRK